MGFEKKEFKKFHYKRSSYVDGIIGKLEIEESGHKIDFLTFKNSNELRSVLSIIKKYGFKINNEDDKEELEQLNKQRNWIDKQEGDMEW